MLISSIFNLVHQPALVLLAISLALGVIHGVTPDEHTWPITFSYAVGSYSTKGGMRAGLFFSLGFTLQRAIFSELAYFTLTGFLTNPKSSAFVYLGVGMLMVASGLLLRAKKSEVRLFGILDRLLPPLDPRKQPPYGLAFTHGLIAGMGTGPFAAILYTAISPVMPTALLGWLPGALFGLGTMIAQVAFGSAFGRFMSTRGFDMDARSYIGRTVASATLGFGGLVFIFSSIFSLLFPRLANFSVSTGINVPNLNSINLGLVMVIITVPVIGGISGLFAVKSARLAQINSAIDKGTVTPDKSYERRFHTRTK